MSGDRGQAYTLEGVIGAIVIASALVLGIQAVNIEPWTDDGPEQGDELRAQVTDTLEIAQDQNALKPALLCLGGTDQSTPHPNILATSPDVTRLSAILNDTLDDASYTVYLNYKNTSVSPPVFNQTVIGQEGESTGSSVVVTRQIIMLDSDPVYDYNNRNCQRTDEELQDLPIDSVYLTDNSKSETYAIVQMRVVAW